MSAIPSATVGVKINDWHEYINRFDAKNAEKCKAEVEKMIEEMEEDQDLLLYYQLISFRHNLMMDYLFPSDSSKKLETWEYLRKSEGAGQKLTKLLKYYDHFFRGMYEFRNGDYVAAINHYQKAEAKIARVTDEIEKAEFYFKMAEVFYHMKQTHVSMYYVKMSYDKYKKHPTYKVNMIKCLFVIAGNYDDLNNHKKALVHLQIALEMAEEVGNELMQTFAYLNMGNSYNRLQSPMAIPLYHQAIKLAKKAGAKEIIQAYYDLSLIHFQNGEMIEGMDFFKKAVKEAEAFENEFYMKLLNVLKALFIDTANRQNVKNALYGLKTEKGYPYFEELALVAAEFYTKKRRMEDSIYFYNEMVCAQRQIQRSDSHYEI
ncbi:MULTISPECIES: aspartate phosphatase [Bacillus subtilis group]|uniref:response regulator aspartate phosphatase n=1 Tax=Bacillus subtilis group TaxID=653685 RepID=UPI002752A9EE|nr:MULTISPECIES: aspartate phosphatase [Bacillus subtilis group]MDP8528951.1 aspartate phosphatase [Bacillus subtilis]MEC1385610.1 aspartate phosphatase [Bacillus velezensis]MED3231428.1 aspartate phosphatase [Bacillus velezensis]